MTYFTNFRSFMNRAALALVLLSGALAVAPALAEAATTDASNNWSGYSATGDSYTGAGGTWIVPTVSSNQSGNLSADATWVGVGGITSKDLIQTGTQAIVQNGVVTYNAWYETLPNAETIVPLTVRAGDQVSASVNEVSTGHWQIVVTNNTTNQQYVATVAYDSKNTSADWIEEMPMNVSGRSESYISLDQFGSATFSSAYAMVNGQRVSASDTDATQLVMAGTNDVILAQASDLSTNGSFTVTRGTGSQSLSSTSSSSSGSGRTRRTTVHRYSQLPSSVFSNIPTNAQYTVTSGNGYRITRVTWSY